MGGLPPFNIKHRGFFDQAKLVSAIQDWYGDEDYYVADILYIHKPGTLGKDLTIEITGSRKASPYIKFHVKVKIRIINMREVEMIKEGKKIKMNEGLANINVTSKVETDWQGRFKKGKFLKSLGELLEKYILKYKISDYWEDKAIMEVLDLVSIIKKGLGQEV